MGIAKWMFGAAAFAAVVAAERPCPAMTAADLTGNAWTASYASKLRLPGIGRATSAATGDVTFAQDGTFSALEDDGVVQRTYGGTWTLSSDETRLKARLTSDGKARLREAIVDMVTDATGATGVRLRFSRVRFKPAPVPATAGPFTVKLIATGSGSGRVGRRRISSTFNYSATIGLTPQ